MPSQGNDSAASTRTRGPDAGGGGSSGSPPFETSPFTDWREQLRERVKEIRARKLADEGRGDDRVVPTRDQSDAARDEKLRAARRATGARVSAAREEVAEIAAAERAEAHVVEAETDAELESDTAGETAQASDSVEQTPTGSEELGPAADEELPSAEEIAAAAEEALARIKAEADATFFADDDAAETAEVDEATETAAGGAAEDVAAESSDDRGRDEAQESPDLEELAAEAPADAPAFAEEELDAPLGDATFAPSGAPWQGDDWESDRDEDDLASAEEGHEEQVEVAGGRLDPERIPVWARSRHAAEPPAESRAAVSPPDLEAIPEALKDVSIPAWAIPRRSARPAPATTEPARETDEAQTASHVEEATAETSASHTAGEHGLAAAAAGPDEHRDDVDQLPWDEEPSTAPPPPAAGSGSGHRDRLDDVYLVGEFTGRRAGGGGDAETDPLEGLRMAADEAATPGPAAGEPAEPPVPDLQAQSDGTEETDPAPFRGLFEEAAQDSSGSSGPGSPTAGQDVDLELDLAADGTMDDAQRTDELDPSAPLTDRIFSALADGMVVLLLGLALGMAGAGAIGTGMSALVRAAPIPFVAAWLVFAFAYGVFFVGTCGQTLGKMAMRVRVIGADHFRVGYAKAARRAMLYALATLPAGLGLLPALNDPEHRALHDRLSGTRVVKA